MGNRSSAISNATIYSMMSMTQKVTLRFDTNLHIDILLPVWRYHSTSLSLTYCSCWPYFVHLVLCAMATQRPFAPFKHWRLWQARFPISVNYTAFHNLFQEKHNKNTLYHWTRNVFGSHLVSYWHGLLWRPKNCPLMGLEVYGSCAHGAEELYQRYDLKCKAQTRFKLHTHK
jgi:hypothetical protein